MRSLPIYDLLRHHEHQPSLRRLRLRHPLVGWCNLGYVGVKAVVYVLTAIKSPGQSFYFLVSSCLYLSSSAYHAVKPSKFLRFIDQTMIGWYVHILPLPFIYHEPWAMPLILAEMALTAGNKWYDWEGKIAARVLHLRPDQEYLVGAFVFFGFGMISFVLVMTTGRVAAGADWISWFSLGMVLATACYIGKLYFHTKGKGTLVKNVWETPESGHCILSVGDMIYMTVMLLHTV